MLLQGRRHNGSRAGLSAQASGKHGTTARWRCRAGDSDPACRLDLGLGRTRHLPESGRGQRHQWQPRWPTRVPRHPHSCCRCQSSSCMSSRLVARRCRLTAPSEIPQRRDATTRQFNQTHQSSHPGSDPPARPPPDSLAPGRSPRSVSLWLPPFLVWQHGSMQGQQALETPRWSMPRPAWPRRHGHRGAQLSSRNTLVQLCAAFEVRCPGRGRSGLRRLPSRPRT